MILTDSRDLASQARYLSTQANDDELEYIHGDVGYTYRLTSLQAAFGLAQLEQLDAFISRKQQIARMYEAGLGGIPGLQLMPHLNGRRADLLVIHCSDR